MTLALCRQVENLKEKLISQAQEVSRLRSELVRLDHSVLWRGVGAGQTLHRLAPQMRGATLSLPNPTSIQAGLYPGHADPRPTWKHSQRILAITHWALRGRVTPPGEGG